MFEQQLIDALVYLAIGYLAFGYTEKFLAPGHGERRRALAAWLLLFGVWQFLLGELGVWSPYDRLLQVLPFLLGFFLLQRLFFEQNLPRQAFSIMSFAAGWEILRFAISPLAHALFSLWNALLTWAVQQEAVLTALTAETLPAVLETGNRAVLFLVIALCRGVQVALLLLYLRTIGRNFVGRDYELRFPDSLFLLFPCATVLCIDLTMKLMSYSLDNGAMLLVYDRVPSTLVLLPLVSLLLLGLVISSVILFQNIVQYKNEEQKRLLLENRVVQVHREIEELTDIYGDIRGLRHDLRNHLANIAACLRKSGDEAREELESYLQHMTDTVDRLDFTEQTGSPITDIILHQARQQARRKGISFISDFRHPPRLDIYDISVILNNALQNALEACEGLGRPGEIWLHSYRKGNFFFLEIENDFAGELKWEGSAELPATKKETPELHGMGLANIRRCARKYRGDIDIRVSGEQQKRFRLTVMLLLPEEEAESAQG